MLHLNPFAVSGLLTLFTCSLLCIGLLKFGKTKSHNIWALFNFSAAFWGGGCYLIGISTSVPMALISWKVAFLGALFTAPIFFHTVTVFCNIKRKDFLFFAYIQAIFFYLLTILTDLVFNENGFYFRSLFFPKARITYHFLLGSWLVVTAYAHFVLFISSKKLSDLKRQQSFYLFYGSLIGFSGGVSSLLPSYGVLIYPYSNFSIPIYFIIVSYAIFAHQLMDLQVAIK